LDVPARLGEPLPMTVLQTISVGAVALLSASSIAASTRSMSWPSTLSMTFQPYAMKRAATSSMYQGATLPSMEMALSS